MKIVLSAFLLVIFIACGSEHVTPNPISLPDNPEELKNLLASEKDDQIKLEIYADLFKHYRLNEPDVAIEYLHLQKILAEANEDFLTAGKACYNIGYVYIENGNYVSAVEYYLKALNHFESINDINRMGSVLNNLGVAFMKTGNHEYSIKFYKKAEEIHRNNGDSRREMLAHHNLGICYSALKEPDYNLAHAHFEKAEILAAKLENRSKYYLGEIHNYMGAMYFQMGKYDLARVAYQKSLEFVDDNETRFIAYSNIGEAEMGAGNYKEAHDWMAKALKVNNEVTIDNELLIEAYNIIGRLYQLEGNHARAVEILEKAIATANDTIINEPLQKSMRIIRQSYTQLNNDGRGVTRNQYEIILQKDGNQDLLEQKLVESTNFQALQSALGLSIELDNEKREKKAEMDMKRTVTQIAIALMALVAVVLYKFRSKAKRLKLASERINKAKQILDVD